VAGTGKPKKIFSRNWPTPLAANFLAWRRAPTGTSFHQRTDIGLFCGIIERAPLVHAATLRCSWYELCEAAPLMAEEEQSPHKLLNQGKEPPSELALPRRETRCGFPTLVIVHKQGLAKDGEDNSVRVTNCPPPLLSFRQARKTLLGG